MTHYETKEADQGTDNERIDFECGRCEFEANSRDQIVQHYALQHGIVVDNNNKRNRQNLQHMVNIL